MKNNRTQPIRRKEAVPSQGAVLLLVFIAGLLSAFQVQGQGAQGADATGSNKQVELAELAIKDGNLLQGLNHFRQAVKADPSNAQAFRLKGALEFRITDYDSAIVSYTRALRVGGDDWRTYAGRGDAYLKKEEWRQALADYDSAVVHGGADRNLHFKRGQCEFALEMWKACVSDMTASFDGMSPMRALYFRGASNSMLNNSQEAIADLTRYIDSGELVQEDIAGAYYYRGSKYVWLAEQKPIYADSAIADFKALERVWPEHPHGTTLLGYAYGLKGDSVQARHYLEKGRELNPQDGDSEYLLAVVESRFGNYKRSSDLFELALERRLSDPLPTVLSYYARAKAGLRDTTSAVDILSRAIKIDSTNLQPYLQRFSIIQNNPKYSSQSIADLTSMIRIVSTVTPVDSASLGYYYSRRSLLWAGQKNFKASKQDADEAVAFLPRSFYPYFNRATVGSMLEVPDRAAIIEDLDRCLQIKGSYWQLWFAKAMMLQNLGEKGREKCKCLKKAIRLGGKELNSKEIKSVYCKNKRLPDFKDRTIQMNFPVEDLK